MLASWATVIFSALHHSWQHILKSVSCGVLYPLVVKFSKVIMPKSKPSKKAHSSDDSSDDSGPDDRGPMKKPKFEEESKGSGDADTNETSWDLGKNRFVKLTEFKGKWYVNIREFYNADGELRPGKKGIMLTMEQWRKFRDIIPDLENAIKRNV